MKKRLLVILIFFGILLYTPSLFGQFLWDDLDFVSENTYVQKLNLAKFWTSNVMEGRGKISNYFRPIQESAYALIWKGFGGWPLPYHAVNILVHIAAAIAVFWFLTKLTGRWKISFLISLVFLIHPIQTEAVSYISGLSDPLWVLFGASSLALFLYKKKLSYCASLIAFILAILSKETGLVILPIMGLLWLLYFPKKNFYILLPFLAITISYLWYHIVFINSQDMSLAYGDTIYVRSVAVRIATFVQTFFSYIALLVFPKDLFMERDFTVSLSASLVNPYFFTFIILNALIAGLLFFLQAGKRKLAMFFFGAFYISLLPYAGIILINGFMYEHFLYFPLVFFFGFIFLMAEGMLEKRRVMAFITVILVLFAVRSVMRQYEWMDPIRFYTQTLDYVPQSARMRNNLAMAYAERGQLENAIDQYEKAILESPDRPNFYHNMGNAYLAKGDLSEAEINYLKAISVDPKFAFSYRALVRLYRDTAQDEKAKKVESAYKEQFGGHTLSL